MNIRLVVLDLDGTILDPHREAPIAPAVVNAVQRTLHKGVGVTLATGRTWEYAYKRVLELGLTLPLVTGQGSSLVEARTGRLLYEVCLPLAAARHAAQCEATFSLYFREPDGRLHIVVNRMQREPGYYYHLLGPETIVETDLLSYLERGCQALKFVVFDAEPGARDRWQSYLGPTVNVSRTHSDLVEATAAGVDKGSGVARLLELLEIPREQVMAVGDNENDLPMFAHVGLAVAMGQAPEKVKRAAAWVAPTFDQDGAAAALNRWANFRS